MMNINVLLLTVLGFAAFSLHDLAGAQSEGTSGVASTIQQNQENTSIDNGQQQPPSLQQQCANIAKLGEKADVAPRVRLESEVDALPGGATAQVTLQGAAPQKSYFCGRLRSTDNDKEKIEKPVRVIKAVKADGNKTILTLGLPYIRFGWQRTMELTLVAFPVDDKGNLIAEKPYLSAIENVRISNKLFSVLSALATVVAFYLLAVLGSGRVDDRYCFDPVVMTSGYSGHASLSQLQIFGFTLLVLGLLVYVLLRTSALSDISEDILLLMGISAAGAGGSKVTGVMKNRLSFENWAWLRDREWLVGYEKGIGQAVERNRASWGDLLKTSGQFDVYSFQLIVVSVLVGLALLLSDLSQLATFTIPKNLMALLGLSNVVYIGGKAVSPNSVGELNQKVTALRDAEQGWLKAVTTQVLSESDQSAKVRKAMETAPELYQTYIAAARETARMLKAIYGAEDTKYKGAIIVDDDLMPQFP